MQTDFPFGFIPLSGLALPQSKVTGPLDFNRKSVLISDMRNHASALQFPCDVDAYLPEECAYDAILGPFTENPITGCHYSPFMTREKTGSDDLEE